MAELHLRPKEDCKYAAVSLGEVMIRLNPNEGRVRTGRTFTASEGGGEYNVTRALKKVFGLNTAVVTALPRFARFEDILAPSLCKKYMPLAYR